MSEREIYDVAVHWSEEKGLTKISCRMTGGETGQHFVEIIDGAMNCDCFGFGRHQHCRHTDALKLMKNALEMYRQEVYEKLNR